MRVSFGVSSGNTRIKLALLALTFSVIQCEMVRHGAAPNILRSNKHAADKRLLHDDSWPCACVLSVELVYESASLTTELQAQRVRLISYTEMNSRTYNASIWGPQKLAGRAARSSSVQRGANGRLRRLEMGKGWPAHYAPPVRYIIK